MRTVKHPHMAVVEHLDETLPLAFGELSQREEQVLSYAAAGYIDKQIGQEIGVSVNTLRTYWQRIRSKIGEAPRSALAAAYVTHIARMNEAPQTEEFNPDWEVNFDTNIFKVVSERPFPQSYIQETSLEGIIQTYVPEDQGPLRELVEQVRRGELEAFYLTGRIRTPVGEQRSSSYVQVVRNLEGRTIKMIGRRVEVMDLSARSRSDYDWSLNLETNMVTRLSNRWSPHDFQPGETMPLEKMIQKFHPSDQSRLRALMVSARKGQVDRISFGGAVVTESGLVPSGAFLTLERNQEGKPVRLMAKKALNYALGSETGQVISVGTLQRDFSKEDIEVSSSLREIFRIPLTEKDVVGALVRRVVPEEAASFRSVLKQALQGKIDHVGMTYRVNPVDGHGFWVRLEFQLTSQEHKPLLLTGRFIAFY